MRQFAAYPKELPDIAQLVAVELEKLPAHSQGIDDLVRRRGRKLVVGKPGIRLAEIEAFGVVAYNDVGLVKVAVQFLDEVAIVLFVLGIDGIVRKGVDLCFLVARPLCAEA